MNNKFLKQLCLVTGILVSGQKGFTMLPFCNNAFCNPMMINNMTNNNLMSNSMVLPNINTNNNFMNSNTMYNPNNYQLMNQFLPMLQQNNFMNSVGINNNMSMMNDMFTNVNTTNTVVKTNSIKSNNQNTINNITTNQTDTSNRLCDELSKIEMEIPQFRKQNNKYEIFHNKVIIPILSVAGNIDQANDEIKKNEDNQSMQNIKRSLNNITDIIRELYKYLLSPYGDNK
ncbi:MAG: hypothetical protein IJ848_00945 [Alphaproteobacteria bacterium]|nr:hypothetical protein [Alphaproteobacteria bacterium]